MHILDEVIEVVEGGAGHEVEAGALPPGRGRLQQEGREVVEAGS